MAERSDTRITIRLVSMGSPSPDRLDLRKDDPRLRRHVVFTEAR